VINPEVRRDRTGVFPRWYQDLPVGELYPGYLTTVKPSWRRSGSFSSEVRELPDGRFEVVALAKV